MACARRVGPCGLPRERAARLFLDALSVRAFFATVAYAGYEDFERGAQVPGAGYVHQ
ncbi:hypothetical protein ACWGJ2_21065 [Streptomyces sp. NPDC054796]